MKISRQAKIEFMAKTLADDAQQRCEDAGGYPDEIEIVASHIVVAELSGDNEPNLQVYTPQYVCAWYDAFQRDKREYPDEGLSEWLWGCDNPKSNDWEGWAYPALPKKAA